MFNSARLKLTAWYLLIITLISVAFSVVIYRMLTLEVDRFAQMQRTRIERRFRDNNLPPMVMEPELIEEVKQRIILNLVIIDGTIILISGVLAYFLADKTLKPIQEMMNEQNRFVSDASHELRTPLTALKSSMEVYLRDKKPSTGETKSLIKGSIDEVNKLKILSDSLLQLAQFKNPDKKIGMEMVNVRKVIETAIKKVEIIAREKNIKLESKMENISTRANKDKLIDLVVILIDNAIKYSDKDGQVEIGLKKINKKIIISVKDEGIGIDEKDLSHIFDRFYRGDNARSKEDKDGYGLGLAIAKDIVETHRGDIIAKSKINEGTTIVVKLPLTFS